MWIKFLNKTSKQIAQANLRSANLSGANLSGADLRSTNLSGADLRSANLRRADLRSAHYNFLIIISSIGWDDIINQEVRLELMRRDAMICGIEKMNAWAEGGKCPFTNLNLLRGYQFHEDRKIWDKVNTIPTMLDITLWQALCTEKEIKL